MKLIRPQFRRSASLLQLFFASFRSSNPLKRMAEKEERGKEEEMAAITAAVKGGKES